MTSIISGETSDARVSMQLICLSSTVFGAHEICTHHRQNLSPHVCMDVLGFLFGLPNLRGLGMKNQHASVVFKVTASRLCGDVFGSCVLKWIRWKESLVLKRKCWL